MFEDSSDHKSTSVFLIQEFGDSHWIWYPGMEPEDLIQWWKGRETVSTFLLDKKGLPGYLRRVNHDEGKGCDFRCHIHDEMDSWLSLPKKEKIYYHMGHKGSLFCSDSRQG